MIQRLIEISTNTIELILSEVIRKSVDGITERTDQETLIILLESLDEAINRLKTLRAVVDERGVQPLREKNAQELQGEA